MSTSTCWPLASMATRRPVDTTDIWPAHASAWACQAYAPARTYRTPAALPPPPPARPLTRGALGTLPYLCQWLCRYPRGLARRPQVALQGFHPGDQAVPLLGDVRQLRLGGPPVVIGPGQAGLEVAVGGLRADRARLPRPRPLQLMLLLHPLPHRRGKRNSIVEISVSCVFFFFWRKSRNFFFWRKSRFFFDGNFFFFGVSRVNFFFLA